MDLFEEFVKEIPKIESALSYSFKNQELLQLAFVHKSFINENKSLVIHHNERLEFLGDAILGMLVTDFLYKLLPSFSEGKLSNIRARLVETPACALYLQSLQIEQYLLLGKGELLNNGRKKESILANLFEAILGAIYLDGGLDTAKDFIFQHFHEHFNEIIKAPDRNWKAELQDYSQRKYQSQPLYAIIKEDGPDHSKIFEIAVFLGGVRLGQGTGLSKKEAEQAAALQALKEISREKEFPPELT